jgi:predicted permease
VSLAFAWGGLQFLVSAMPERIVPFVPGWHNIDIDPRLMVVITVTALVASVVFSLFPALQASRPNMVASLKEGGRSIAGGRSGRVLRGTLVVGQIALAVPLLVTTGLTASATDQYAHGPQGYDPEGVVTLRTVLSEATHSGMPQRRLFTEQLIEKVRQIPGVTTAGTTSAVPSGNTSPSRELIVDGRPDEGPARRPVVPYRVVSAGYFETMRIPMLQGRAFDATDSVDGPLAAVVSEALATRLFPGESALGKRIRVADTEDQRWITIVGVAGTIVDDWFNRRHGPMVYLAMPQRPTFAVNLVARTDLDQSMIASRLREALRAVDPAQPPVHVLTMSTLLRDRTTGLRMISAMMGVLGVLALILAAIGLYSLMSYQVRQRRHEIGVRMALGASRGGVIRMTIRRASWLAGLGVAIGLVPAYLLSGVMRNVMFGVVTPGVALYAVIVVAVAGIAVLASTIPARQAAQVDPAVALRGE